MITQTKPGGFIRFFIYFIISSAWLAFFAVWNIQFFKHVSYKSSHYDKKQRQKHIARLPLFCIDIFVYISIKKQSF